MSKSRTSLAGMSNPIFRSRVGVILTVYACDRMWSKLTRAIVAKDMDAATEAKTAVEESQREARRRMDERGEVHVPRFFQERNGRWEPKLQCVSSPSPNFMAFLAPPATPLTRIHRAGCPRILKKPCKQWRSSSGRRCRRRTSPDAVLPPLCRSIEGARARVNRP